MTFNVQLMTRMLSKGKFDLGELFADPFEYRLDRLQKALASEPVPDLLVLNEVFSEEARGRLLTMLSPYFAYIEPSFGPTDVFDLITNLGKIDDGGLMLCSQWPFQVVKFAAFAESAGWDSVANKGFAVVTVEAQPHGIAVVLTHLQADEANAHVRLLQLQQIRDTLTDPALANVISEFPVILCGDLNVIGNPPRPEWEGVFDDPPPGGPFLDLFTDGWNSHMPRADQGLTTASGRLDYILLNHSPVRDLVTQHMRIRHRGVSDHFAVLADVNVKSDCCTPTSARVVQQVHPQWCGAEALAFAYPGSMQWCRIDSPGTYVFTKPPNHALRIFEATNISEPLPDFDRRAVDLQELPGSQAAWQEMDLPPVGRKFHLPNAPFYVQLTNPADAAQPTRFGWVRCRDQPLRRRRAAVASGPGPVHLAGDKPRKRRSVVRGIRLPLGGQSTPHVHLLRRQPLQGCAEASDQRREPSRAC